jgi:hypothetical protein
MISQVSWLGSFSFFEYNRYNDKLTYKSITVIYMISNLNRFDVLSESHLKQNGNLNMLGIRKLVCEPCISRTGTD